MGNLRVTVNTPLEEVEQMLKGTLVENLGIKITEVHPERVVASMPVDRRTIQPANILHGGATIALAETIAGFGSYLNIDSEKEAPRGLQLSTNHVSSAVVGEVIGTATLVHKGKSTHVWNVDVHQGERLISSIRVTNMIIQL